MEPAQHRALANSFGSAAAAYERGRPSFPEAALDWLLPVGATTVLDLGAGTGKLTRLLTARGLDVTAVDPSEGMLDELRRAVPDARALPGTAEAIPLPDACVDVVLVAQAWHWVDPPRAVPEVARVLRPGGTLGLLWNSPDDRVEWVARLVEITEGGLTRSKEDAPTVGPPFGPLESHTVEWVDHTTRAAFRDGIRSRSAYILAAEEERVRRMASIDELLDSHEPVDPDELDVPLDVPYETWCCRARLG